LKYVKVKNVENIACQSLLPRYLSSCLLCTYVNGHCAVLKWYAVEYINCVERLSANGPKSTKTEVQNRLECKLQETSETRCCF